MAIIGTIFWSGGLWATVGCLFAVFAGAALLRRLDERYAEDYARKLEAIEPGPIVTVSSALDELGESLIRTIRVGEGGWKQRHPLDPDPDRLAAQIARHRVADERLRHELEAGRLPEEIAVEARRRGEAVALLEAELPGLPSAPSDRTSGSGV